MLESRRHAVLVLMALCVALAWPAAGRGEPAEEFSNEVASRLLGQVTQGFVTNNANGVLGAFDAGRMRNYGEFRDRIQALFANYESFRAAYRLRQSWPEGERGVVIVDFELEGQPLEEGAPPLRRNAQLRFEFVHGRNGWKIVEVTPREFFS
jgi:hypothetical protein